MNLVLKLSILALLTASGVGASNLCIQTGNQAAQLIIIDNWCQPSSYTASDASLDPEERCRELAISTCRGGFLNAIDQICPRDPRTPSTGDLLDWGDDCESRVDGLITRGGYVQANEAVFAAKTAKENSPVVDGYRAGQQAVRNLWKRRNRSDCRNVNRFKIQARRMKARQFPDEGNSNTKARNQSARLAVDNEVKKIDNECTQKPTPPPTPDNSVVRGYTAGQQAMQKWWRDEGSDCANAWGLKNTGNDMKDRLFPDSGNSNKRAHNQSARSGVDNEVKKIQEMCFSAADEEDELETM